MCFQIIMLLLKGDRHNAGKKMGGLTVLTWTAYDKMPHTRLIEIEI